jgi:hypothetical protein
MDDKWVEVDSSDVGHNGRELDESAFTDLFGRLTALPAIAFQARPERRGVGWRIVRAT